MPQRGGGVPTLRLHRLAQPWDPSVASRHLPGSGRILEKIMLNITNLHANVGDKPILKGLTLTLNAGGAHKPLGLALGANLG